MPWKNMGRARCGYGMVTSCSSHMNPSLSSWLLLNGATQFVGAPKSLQGVMNSANLAATLEKDDGPAW